MATVAPGEPSTVWILGAGFSRALGAPLFKDLFRSDHVVRASGLRVPGMLDVLGQYRKHAPDELGGTGSLEGLLWRDPEEFLDVVESANSGTTAAAGLLKITSGMNVADLADKGRRALAVECSYFLWGADLKTERWLPYRTWAKALTEKDTVITFNYDRVPDLLEEHEGTKLMVIVPDGEADSEISEANARNCAPVFKLHGSVDWVAKNGKIEADPAINLPETCANGSDLVLGVPGPDKIGLRKKYRPLSFLWGQARAAIQKSTRIIFVGYRFPQTDASARIEILQNVKAAFDVKTLVKVQIVLGPNENAPDVARMKKLLGFVCPGKVEVLPLYAEDFLSLPNEWTT